LSEEKFLSTRQHGTEYMALLLATVLSVVGACAMGASVVLQRFSARRFGRNFNANFNMTRTFNATAGQTFSGQFMAQRVPMSFLYASWLSLLGFGCLIAIAIILISLLFLNRAGSSRKGGKTKS